jgi:hypothetical protein
LCQDAEPLLKLEDNGKAPILNYSLQQDTSFTAYSSVSMNLPEAYFTDLAKQIPANLPTRQNPPTTPFVPADFAITYDDGVEKPAAWGVEVLTQAEMSMLRTRAFTKLTNLTLGTSNLNQAILSAFANVDLDSNVNSRLFNFRKLENAWKEVLEEYLGGYNPAQIAEQRNLGELILITNINGGGKQISYSTRPTTGGANPNFEARPQFYFVQEYKTISFARDYGAGKTLQIHSLFPSEKTTITIKTFKEMKTVKSNAENIIDSFSQESASEFESILEDETNNNVVKTRGGGVSVGGRVSLDLKKGGVGLGSADVSGSANFSASNTRTSNARNLSKSISKSVDKSNSSRQININTSTQETQTESEEVATVRQFENINKSRVLNLAFRELLQQYITIIYLNDVKIMFSNGHSEYDLIFSIEDLHELLATHIVDDAKREEIKDRILFEYGKLNKETNNAKVTVEGVNVATEGLIEAFSKNNFGGQSVRYLRKNPNLRNVYKHATADSKGYTVEGVILEVQNYTLRTPAVVVDAFLGHGEALDCYSVAMQQEAVRKTQLDNAKMVLDNAKMVLDNEKLALDNQYRQQNEVREQ